jgi:hypothetical protein
VARGGAFFINDHRCTSLARFDVRVDPLLVLERTK